MWGIGLLNFSPRLVLLLSVLLNKMVVFIMLLMELILNLCGGIRRGKVGSMGLSVRRLNIFIMIKLFINNGKFFVI